MSDEETSQGNSRWLLVAGCWLLVAGCWLLVAGCWLLVAGCWLLHVKKLAEQLEGGEEKPT
jgi:protein gp37